VAGFALMVVGYALFLRVDLDPVYAAVILPSMLLIGAACALVFPSLNIQATNGVDDHEQGMVSGLLNTSVQVGGAIFLAIVTAVVTANTSESSSPQAVLDSYRPGLVVVTAIAVVGLLITATGLRGQRTRQTTILVAKSDVTGRRAAVGARAGGGPRLTPARDRPTYPSLSDRSCSRTGSSLSMTRARRASSPAGRAFPCPAGRTPVRLPVWDRPGGGGLSPSGTR
jgi:NADH:ubiquinone oxidoreductase subunit 6 (subunit J)